MVRFDLKSRYEAHEIAIRAGFLTVNEVRELEDRGPLPDDGGAVA
jgi:phage portal protein BeeE